MEAKEDKRRDGSQNKISSVTRGTAEALGRPTLTSYLTKAHCLQMNISEVRTHPRLLVSSHCHEGGVIAGHEQSGMQMLTLWLCAI